MDPSIPRRRRWAIPVLLAAPLIGCGILFWRPALSNLKLRLLAQSPSAGETAPRARVQPPAASANVAPANAAAPGAQSAPESKRYDDLIAEGHRLLNDHKPLEAYASAAEAAGLDDRRFQAFALEAMVMREQGDLPKASALVEKALSRAPDAKKPALLKLRGLIVDARTTDGEFRAHFDAARQAVLENKFAKAAGEYEAAWKIKPDEGGVGYQAAQNYAAMNDYPRSIPIARRVASSSNPDAAAKAKALLEKLKAVVDPIVRTKTDKAEALLADGKPADADAVIREAISLDPNPAHTTFLLARALAGEGRTAPALDACEQAIALGYAKKDDWLAASELASIAGEDRFIALISDAFGVETTKGIADKLRAVYWARAKPIINSVEMKLVPIAPGVFTMGSPPSEEGRDWDEAQHIVTLTRGFFMQATPVTQAQWTAVMGTNPSDFRGDNRPVENVSWHYACWFCRALSQKEGRKYRLPTEAEWEYACRAGTATRFYSGDAEAALGRSGWYRENSGHGLVGDSIIGTRRTHPVGTKAPNAWGLFDMHGNVWQWCSDPYGPYGGATTDPLGAAASPLRVVRGGSWYDDALLCRSAVRYGFPPARSLYVVGFRVCMDR